MSDIIPPNTKHLRACLSCSLLKSLDQFYNNGCENCVKLKLKGDKARIEECTTSAFEGFAI